MILPIVKYGDVILRKKAAPVTDYNDNLSTLIENMKETMQSANGVGIAAPQIGESIQLFLVDASYVDESMDIIVVINPTITVLDPKEQIQEEGCLSIPGIYARVKRPSSLELKAFNEKGEPFTMIANDYLARIILHEYDHLIGVLFIDKILALDKAEVENQLKIMRKDHA